MTLLVHALLGFAGWTLLVSISTVGRHRSSGVLAGAAQIASTSALGRRGF